jgi:hypothetical protein
MNIPSGESVIIVDLVKNTSLNMSHGTILKWYETKKRYAVKCHYDKVNRLIKPCNLNWVKIRKDKPSISDNTITLFIRANTHYAIDFPKLLEIFLFPPATKYNDNEYFDIENQERGSLNYIVITIQKDFIEKVFSLVKKLNFNIVEGVPIIKVLNGDQIDQLHTKSKQSYELKLDLQLDKISQLNRKDVDEYLNLVKFNNVIEWLHYYFPDKSNITKNMAYDAIMGFFNGKYCPTRKDYITCELPEPFFI